MNGREVREGFPHVQAVMDRWRTAAGTKDKTKAAKIKEVKWLEVPFKFVDPKRKISSERQRILCSRGQHIQTRLME